MAHKRTNFTENQKARIFVRDRATCAFSGLSVWLFDQGIRPNFEIDWADHIVPSAKGGKSELSNGVCASSFFNAKKKDNGSDNKFFFLNGQITPTYISVYGPAPDQVLADLDRRKPLRSVDWYVNRAIANTFFALDWRCELEFFKKEYNRDDQYYFKSAFRMLDRWIQDSDTPSIESRALLKVEYPFGTQLLLDIENIQSKHQFLDWAEAIWPIYRVNWKAYRLFMHLSDLNEKKELYEEFSIDNNANPQVVKGLGQLLSLDHQITSKAA